MNLSNKFHIDEYIFPNFMLMNVVEIGSITKLQSDQL